MRLKILVVIVGLTATANLYADEPLPLRRYPSYGSPNIPSGLEAWREKRVRDFWNPTSPFFGDPYYDPLKTSPFSPFRSPQYHPWSTSPFRGDPSIDPYAPRGGRLDFYRRRR